MKGVKHAEEINRLVGGVRSINAQRCLKQPMTAVEAIENLARITGRVTDRRF